ILVDDSFPHCFDTTRAIARMRLRGDVLVVGGGLLHCGTTERRSADGLPATVGEHTGRFHHPGTIASCQLESLLHAATPGLPPVHGLVDLPLALAYRDAVEAAGARAGPLHLLDHTVDPTLLDAFRRPGAEDGPPVTARCSRTSRASSDDRLSRGRPDAVAGPPRPDRRPRSTRVRRAPG
ncbi:MAG TPA: hypothetical protein VGR21_12915, partial [Cryptosporangiaceae bacterium]|nr:hypothetical protein [Cryptosporangiaceae bacterium]